MGQYTIHGERVLVDAADAHLVSEFTWHIHKSGPNRYVRGFSRADGRKSGLKYMHRVILGAAPGEEVDHANGNGLDNRRGNIRFCTRSQNNANRHRLQGSTSSHKGVHLETFTGRWRAEITAYGTRYRLGRFDTEADAAEAYDRKARELFPCFGHGASHGSSS